MLDSKLINDVLHTISQTLRDPTVIVLILMVASSVVIAGSLFMEFITERRRMKASIPELMDKLEGKRFCEITHEIENSALLRRQKSAILELTKHGKLQQASLRALARQLLSGEEAHYEKIVMVSDVLSRVGPVFGLMGTLIPLGPGLIALGQGDTKTLADCILVAFDTTVAGLITSAVCFTVSRIRSRWYEGYMVSLETLMACILEEACADGSEPSEK
jgi:biopolymer transport protein ExbB/TolQ